MDHRFLNNVNKDALSPTLSKSRANRKKSSERSKVLKKSNNYPVSRTLSKVNLTFFRLLNIFLIVDNAYLTVIEGYVDNCKITQMQYHPFLNVLNTNLLRFI